MQKKIAIVICVMMLAALACNLSLFGGQPTVDANVVMTAAAQTIAAGETVAAGGVGPAASTPTQTVPAPIIITNTPVPTLTPTNPGTCNQATFVTDVTIPDGTNFNFGQTFTKTWRLKNSGTCTWTSGYSLVFDHGDSMAGPAAQVLTSGTVAPGATLDVSVNLTAPGTAGSYRGYWRLREPGGVLFGLPSGNSFYVDIKVVNPLGGITLVLPPILPPLLVLHTVNLVVQPGNSGSVRSDGTVISYMNLGDTAANISAQGFVSFDFTGIPAGSNIVDATATFNNYDTLGNPFSLGCLRMYGQVFGAVNAGDYFGGATTGSLLRWCTTGELDSTMASTSQLISYIQSHVGDALLQFRLQFNDMATNSNGVDDMVRFGNGIKLTVKYTTP